MFLWIAQRKRNALRRNVFFIFGNRQKKNKKIGAWVPEILAFFSPLPPQQSRKTFFGFSKTRQNRVCRVYLLQRLPPLFAQHPAQQMDVKIFPGVYFFRFGTIFIIRPIRAIITISNIKTMAKRIWRNDMPQTQKDKIAAANTGKRLSDETKRKIAQAMAKYWAKLPYKPPTASGTTGNP